MLIVPGIKTRDMKVRVGFIAVFIACYAFKMCLTNRTNHQLGLMTHLMANYGDGYARPVKDGNMPTKIIFRCLLGELIEMNTREQRLTISVYLKMTWKDEFLGWNPSDWGNISSIHIPAHRIWLPDLTLYNNVDPKGMISLPTNMHLIAYADSTIKWYSPAILKSSCNQRVKYFPFDTQVCLLRFSSWSAHMGQIDLWSEGGLDASQVRFLEDGTWKFINATIERREIKYNCCPKPFSELFYHVLFRRRPDFYINYTIVPCCLLSMLSVMVFYLPPDCGEKLTLSITNLLALVVFQQSISQTMPPSPDANPVLGTFFTIMIVMVCSSVLITVLVIHIGFNTYPMPYWVEWLFIKCIARALCITNNKTNLKLSSFYENHGMQWSTNGLKPDQTQSNKTPIPKEQEETTSRQNGYLTSTSAAHIQEGNNLDPNSVYLFAKIANYVENIHKDIQEFGFAEELPKKWKLVAIIVDRCLLYIFICMSCITTVVLMLQIIRGSEEDYELQLNTWFGTNESSNV